MKPKNSPLKCRVVSYHVGLVCGALLSFLGAAPAASPAGTDAKADAALREGREALAQAEFGKAKRLLEAAAHRYEKAKATPGHTNVVFIYSVDAQTPPPAALADKPDQIGFNDLPGGDPIKSTIRCGLLFMSNGREEVPSFGCQLARLYLAAVGIGLEPDPRVPEHLRLGATTFRPFEANDGAFVHADAAGYQFLLDYRGPR